MNLLSTAYLWLLFSAWLAAGVYLLVSTYLHLPSRHAKKMLALQCDESNIALSEALYQPVAKQIAKWIPLGRFRKRRLARQLSAAGVDMTPEYYVAGALTMGLYLFAIAAILLLLSVQGGLLFLLMGLWMAFMAGMMVRRMLLRVRKWTRGYHQALEADLPKLGSAIRQAVKIDRNPDMYYVLEQYVARANPAMKAELTILLADMRTGPRIAALNRFEARLNSPHASTLVKAIIGIEREGGAHMQELLDGLDRQLRDWEILQLREEAQNRPSEFNPAYIGLLLAMILLYATLFGTVLLNAVQAFNQY
ncbi:hypothetical protein [Ethanoligenens sp.]|uniref:hypothetical protein n=1 Tax=Ethanoligenens sp. TaxID=2099655 RepID=UPI0039E7EF86